MTAFYVVLHHVIILTITQYDQKNKSTLLQPLQSIGYRTETWTGSREQLAELTMDRNFTIKFKTPSICCTAYDTHLVNVWHKIRGLVLNPAYNSLLHFMKGDISRDIITQKAELTWETAATQTGDQILLPLLLPILGHTLPLSPLDQLCHLWIQLHSKPI